MTKICPLLKKPCIEHQCEWFVHLVGMNPQTGQPTDEWGCSIKWLPVLLVENSQQQRQTAASVDKVANQVQRSRSEFLGALPEEARGRLISAKVELLPEAKAP